MSETDNETSTEEDSRSYNPWIGDPLGNRAGIFDPDCSLRDPQFDIVRWYWTQKAILTGMSELDAVRSAEENLLGSSQMGHAMEEAIKHKLARYCPTEGDQDNNDRFSCEQSTGDIYLIWDFAARITMYISHEQLKSGDLNIVDWYMECLDVECNKATPSGSGYSALERNAAITKDITRTIPKPVVVVVHVNEQPARALVDTGSLADFMSLNLAEQLQVKRVWLEKPLPIQLAVQGSRSKVNFGVNVRFQYQGADYQRYFDVINLGNYDIILGTPFLYQHQALVGLNSSRLIIGCKEHELARPLCPEGGATALPPFRAINHSIPLIDESKISNQDVGKSPRPKIPAPCY